jgi:hypothetical protein
MKFSNVLLAGVAALAIVACGKKDKAAEGPASETSAQAAKADASSPLDARFSLKDAEPVDIDAFLALFPDDSRPTYETATFDKSLGATVVQNLRFADAEDGEAVIVARAEFFGLDMDALERVRSAEGAGADAPFETIFDKVRLHDVASEGLEDGEEAVAMTIGGVEFDTLQIRQGGVEGDGAGDEGARFVNAVNLAGIYLKDFSLTTDSPDAPAVVMSAPDLRFVGLGGGKLGAVIANDVQYEVAQTPESLAAMSEAMGPQAAVFLSGPLAGFVAPEQQQVKMKTLEWRNIDFSGLLPWGLKGEAPPMTEAKLIDLGTMKATGMETIVNGKRAATVAEATMSAGEFTWLAPSNLKFDSKGVVYDFTAYVPEAEEAAVKALKDHGLDNVKGAGSAAWVWNSKSGAADLNYVATMEKVADVSAKVGFSNLKLADMAAAMESGETDAVLNQGALKGFSLEVKDEKALDAIFALAALQMGGTGEDLRMSVPAMIRLSGAQAAQMNPRIAGYVDALANFVSKGGSLAIAAAPAEPVAFTALQATTATAPQTFPDVINLTVTHKE